MSFTQTQPDHKQAIVHFGGTTSTELVQLLVCLGMESVPAEQVPVRHKEGLVHGFLALRTLQGETVADGDLIQTARSERVTTRPVFHFKDGSIHDDTAVYSERGSFRLVSEHLIQKGPAFEHPIDMTVNERSAKSRCATRKATRKRSRPNTWNCLRTPPTA